MQRLLEIQTKFRPYRRMVLTGVFFIILSIILYIVLSETIFTRHEYTTTESIPTTSIPIRNKSCSASTLSPIPCGCPATVKSKIINGQPAHQSAWPWMISFGPKRLHICGGTLIAPEYILTAAHCFHSTDENNPLDISTIEIRIGLTNLQDVTNENLFFIRKLTVHDDFQPETYKNDIALIRLDRPVRLSDTTQILCLPRFTSSVYPPVNRTTIAIGWGHTIDPLKDPNSLLPSHLQQTSLPILSNCFQQELDAPDQQFCAGYEDGSSDTCQADSGSPLMLFEEEHWELAGIVSYGIGCGEKLLPGVYIRVSAFLDWINDRIHF